MADMRTRSGCRRMVAVTAVIFVTVAAGCCPTPGPTPTSTTTSTSTSTSTSTTTTTTAPTPCVPGTFSATGSSPCTPAPAGSYVDVAGATTANLCALGTFQDLVGATSCTLAPIGFYVDTVGAVAATACPANFTTTATGATAASACVQVPAFTWTGSGAPVGLTYSEPLNHATTGSVSGTVTLNCSGSVLVFAGSISFYRGTGIEGAGGFYPDFLGGVVLSSTFATCGTAYPITPNGTWAFSAGDQIVVSGGVSTSPATVSLSFSLNGPLGAGPTQVLNTLTP